MELHIRFCTSADGTRIAYATLGDGPPLVVVFGWGGSMEHDWEHPDSQACLESLSRGRLYVGFDHRGIGASQRDVDDVSLKAQVADVEALVDHIGLERFDLFGGIGGAPVSVAYAVEHPERVSRLVLWTPYPCGEEIARPEAVRSLVGLVRGNWSLARRAIANVILPSGPSELQRWWSNVLRQSVSPEVAAKYVEFQFTVDVRSHLPQVKAPTLVVHRRGDRNVPIAAGRAAAALIPDARFLALKGDAAHGFFGDISYVETITQFLDEPEGEEATATPELPEGMAVLLFADIVESTALTEELGDAAFRAKARELDASLRSIIGESGGTPVEGKVLGDGVLAVFTSARQAIECALRCNAASGSVGLQLHLGIHAGDVIREGNNVYGGAVNIAARIAGASAPREVLVSDTVRSLARTSAGVAFDDRGEQELKGVADPQRLYAVRGGG
jgi:class 3 adenylate cyclase